jgi:hypothetical protein
MLEAMLRGWAAQQAARGLREVTITARERLVRSFEPPAHVDKES